MPEDVKVLSVAGYGRSGSTLLDRVLGRIDGVFSAGELRHIWLEGFVENRRCGCGEPFRSCPFWNEVTDRAFGGMDRVDASAILELKGRVDRAWLIPRLIAGPGGAFGRRIHAYTDPLRRLYRAIADASGCDVIVDSTKDVSHVFLQTRIGEPIRLHVLHLVRDPRGAAHSWARKKYHPGWGREMQRYGPLRAGSEWTLINGAASLLRSRVPRYALLRYEDIAADPRAAVDSVLRLLEEEGRTPPWIGERTIELGIDHTVAGNPVRFHRGPLEIRGDEEWREQMPPRAKALVTGVTAPLLPAYGFPVLPSSRR